MMVDALANFISAAHLAYFVFVVGGFFATAIGFAKRRAWIRNPWICNPWFRVAHLLSVWFVVTEGWIGFKDCPLNLAEHGLRSSSQGAAEAASGFGYVLDQLLFHTIPGWFLNGLYWVLAVALLILLFAAPPRWRRASICYDDLRVKDASGPR